MRYGAYVQWGRNTDSPCAQCCSPERHKEQTEQRAWYAHVGEVEHSTDSQKHEDECSVGDKRKDTHRDCGPEEK